VILGILVSDLIVGAIGTGPWQAGIMYRARDGPAAVRAGRLGAAGRRVGGVGDADRDAPRGGVRLPARELFLEAAGVGGGVALAVAGLLFPPNRRCTSAVR